MSEGVVGNDGSRQVPDQKMPYRLWRGYWIHSKCAGKAIGVFEQGVTLPNYYFTMIIPAVAWRRGCDGSG